MTGANYMGGKRNFAKARSRDTVGRIQKDFFGRKRFEQLFSKGFGTKKSKETFLAAEKPSALAFNTINLAHAYTGSRIKATRGQLDSENRTPTLGEAASSQPVRDEKLISESIRSSRVLKALDTDPMFRRSTLQRVLSIPDLACLRPIVNRRSKMRPERSPTSHTPRPSSNGCKISDIRSARHVATATNKSGSSSSRLSSKPSSLLDLPRCDFSHDTYDNLAHSLARHSRSRTPQAKSLVTPYKMPINSHHSYLSISSQKRLTSSPLCNSPVANSPLPPSSEQFSSEYESTYASRLLLDDFPPPHSLHGHSMDSPRRSSFATKNNLFEHDDPWHTIGVILGLSPATSEMGDDANDNLSMQNSARAKVLLSSPFRPPPLSQRFDAGHGSQNSILDFEDELDFNPRSGIGSSIMASANNSRYSLVSLVGTEGHHSNDIPHSYSTDLATFPAKNVIYSPLIPMLPAFQDDQNDTASHPQHSAMELDLTDDEKKALIAATDIAIDGIADVNLSSSRPVKSTTYDEAEENPPDGPGITSMDDGDSVVGLEPMRPEMGTLDEAFEWPCLFPDDAYGEE